MVMTALERAVARRSAHQRWNAKNPEWAPEHGRRQAAVRRAIVDPLKDRACMDCDGSFPPECMDFDHRPDEVKRFNIGEARRSVVILLAEIAKCDLVCANCHRIRTRERKLIHRAAEGW